MPSYESIEPRLKPTNMKIIDFGPPNTLCPYLNLPLSEISIVNAEHVLPFALGAPESFTVNASQSENSRLNKLVDAPAINDPMVCFLSSLAEIKTRSGPKVGVLHGATKSGDQFKIDVTKSSATPRFKIPIIKDERGNAIGVRGFGDQVFTEAEKLTKGLRSKGRELGSGPMILIDGSGASALDCSFVSDLNLIRREAIKTAYLLTVKVFGDNAIVSKSGRFFRAAIEANSSAELEASGIYLDMMPPDHYKNIHRQKTKYHLLTTDLDDEWMTTQIVLFGGLHYVFWTPRDDIEMDNCSSSHLIDAAKACFIERPDE
jgi:hypothetical protein